MADLIDIARASGAACGYLHTASGGEIDVVATINAVAQAKTRE